MTFKTMAKNKSQLRLCPRNVKSRQSFRIINQDGRKNINATRLATKIPGMNTRIPGNQSKRHEYATYAHPTMHQILIATVQYDVARESYAFSSCAIASGDGV